TQGTGGSTLVFDTVSQEAYWYSELSYPTGSDNGGLAAGSYTANLYFDSLPSAGSPQVDANSTGDTRPASLTVSHTTGSGTDRLMLVGISMVNDELETVTSVTYNGVSLTSVGTVASVDDARVEIWRLIAPATGTHDAVISFSAPLRRSAVAGVMTFTGVHQTTPLGSFKSASGQAPTTEPTLNVTSATDELVFDTVACESCTSFAVGAGQTQRWNISEPSGSSPTLGAGSTEAGASTVTMSWTRGVDDHWAIGAVPIKPSGGSAPAADGTSSGSTQRTGITISHATSGTDRLMLVGVTVNPNQDETVSSITYNGTSLTLVGSAQQSNDARVEIWRLIAPDTGTHDVVISFSASLLLGAKAGVATFTGVHQTTPLGTFASANGDSAGPATVDISSASNELVFDTVGCEGCTSLSVGAGQTQRWYLTALENSNASFQELAGASTEPGAATVTMSWTLGATNAWAIGAVPVKPAGSGSVDITVYAQHTATDGSGATTITSASTTITGSTANPLALDLGTGSAQTFTPGNPRLLQVWVDVTGVSGGGSFTLAYDSASDPSSLDTPVVTVPEWGAAFLLLVPLIPYLMTYVWKRRRLAGQLASVLLALSLTLMALASDVQVAAAAPDTFYLRPTTLYYGRQMTRGVFGSSATDLRIDTASIFTWFSTETYPIGNDNATIPAGAYTFTLDYTRALNGSTITFTAQVGLTDPDGSNYTQIGESSSQTTADAGGPQSMTVTVCSSCSAQTITAAAPKKLVFRINVTAYQGSGIDLRYDNSAGSTSDSRLDTPTIVVPEFGLALLPAALLLPLLGGQLARRRRLLLARIRSGGNAGLECQPAPIFDLLRIAKGVPRPTGPAMQSSRHSSCNSDWSKGA
ncbi:MAG TPA: hypothetical protein VGA07_13200, partial [Anaerolineales bacterium]